MFTARPASGGFAGAADPADAGAASSMRREASVDDLFAPMWRLDVQSSSTGEPARGSSIPSIWSTTSTSSSAANNVSSREQGPCTPIPIPSSSAGGVGIRTRETALIGATPHSWPSSNCSVTTEVDTEVEVPARSSSYSAPGVHVPVEDLEIKLQVLGSNQHMQSGVSAASDHPLSNSASDDEQVAVDERKQRRMLSNRESARRSRLRKQQHLDELRAQVAHLRGENNQIISKYSLATQHYAQINEENRVLRSRAMELSRQLQRLHHAAAGQHPGGIFGMNRIPDNAVSDIS